jgi:tRNA-Thr(GGU) m(6)t(6)A37 methyltransferase TsaA
VSTESEYSLRPIGVVRSGVARPEDAPKQGTEGAPEAWVEIDPAFADAVLGLTTDDEIILVTWLHLGRRDVLRVHPRDDPRNPLTGVFATRSQDRPNPIGLHRVKVLMIDAPARLKVWPLEAVDGTPVVDIKIALSGSDDSPIARGRGD